MPNLKADLAWLKQAPHLLKPELIASKLVDLSYWDDLTISSQAEETTFPKLSSGRLGLYFEQLFVHLIRHDSHYKLLEHNLQIHHEQRTIGEFDCVLIDNESNEVIHTELAVKFYLQLGSGKQLSDWVGPNYRDRLDIKYTHLVNHQLQLSRHPEVSNWLQMRQLKIDHAALFTRGRLYYPLNDYVENNYSYPDEVNDDHQKGFWCGNDELEDFARLNPNITWYQLAKPFWLADIKPDLLRQLVAYIPGQNQQLQQVVAMSNNKEIMRGFVVTDEWLSKAKTQLAKDLGQSS